MGGLKTTIGKIFRQKSGRLQQLWEFRSEGQILGPLAVEDIDNDGQNEILFGTNKGELFCLIGSGMVKWKFNVHENLSETDLMFFDLENLNSINTKPHIADINGDGKKEIIFGSEMGLVYCLNSLGQLLWKYKAADAIRGGVTTADITSDSAKEVIFGCMDSYLYVLTFTGKLLWKVKTKAPIESTPGVYKEAKQIIFGTNDGTLYSVNYQGKLTWGFKAKEKISAQPIIAKLWGDEKDYILVGSYDGLLYCLENNGALKWTFTSAGPIVSAVCVFDVNNDRNLEIFFGSCDNRIYALNAQGDKLWEYETNFWVVDSPIVADIDNDQKVEVIAGSYDNTLYILDSKGSYELEYVPGLSGVVQQAGHYSDIMTHDPGKMQGKKLWDFQCRGVVVGVAVDPKTKKIVVAEKLGDVQEIALIQDK
jgi:outer membrane protein assembly factor BamB